MKDVKTVTALYDHMCKKGTITDRPGRENYEALIEVLRDVGTDDPVVSGLENIIHEHRDSPLGL